MLSATTLAENTGANATVGTFSTTDADAGATHTYSLVSGTGSTDNGAFNISGNQLRITASPNFEAKSSYAIRVRTTDQGGLSFERTFTISITNVNEAPVLSPATLSIAENSPNATAVGTVSATDPDAGTTLTYSITGGNTNGAFTFVGNQLRVANTAALDFEATPTFTLTVQVSDGALTASNTVTVNLTDVNEAAAPTALGLSPQSVAENTAAGSAIGNFSTTDPNAGDTHTYALVSGTGSTDNGAFSISGNQLRITASPNFEDQSSYAIRVRTTDQGGLFFERTFTISVTNVVEAPVITDVSPEEGEAGDTVIITGGNYQRPVGGAASAPVSRTLAAVTSVEFNGVPATFTILSPTQIQAVVPAGATTGPVTVASPEGSASSPTSFGVIVPPADLTVSTTQSIPAGTYNNVTITGTGVGTLSGNVTVNGTMVVQANGRLATNCFTVGGPGAFVLAARARLTICNPQGINATGATGAVQVTGARTFSPHADYTYNGTAAQVTGNGLPARVASLTHLNNQPLTLSQPVAIRRQLRIIADGNLVLNSHVLTLLSDADSTAMVVNDMNGAVVGTVTVQRSISPGTAPGLAYRHLSSPVEGADVADLATAQFTPRVNSAYNAIPTPTLPASQFPNVLGFDETRGGPTAGFSTGYFSPVALTTDLVSGRGYSVYLAPTTPDFVGTLATGPVTVSNLTRTGNNGKSGWQLLGNPYASPLDWDLVSVPAGLSPTIFVWKSTGGTTGAYRTRQTNGNGTGTGNLTDGILPMGQGFFGQVTGAGPVSFSFQNAHRVTDYVNPPLYRAAATSSVATPQLSLVLTGADGLSDETFVLAPATATLAATDLLDAAAPGRNVGVPTLRTLGAAGEELAINALPLTSLPTGTTVELLLDVPTAGAYALTVGERQQLDGVQIELLDRTTNTRYDLATQPTVSFTTPAGETRGRFALVVGQRVLGTSNLAPGTSPLTLSPNPAHGMVRLSGAAGTSATVLDATGRVVRTASLTAGAADFSLTGLAPGVYVVRAGAAAQRLVIE